MTPVARGSPREEALKGGAWRGGEELEDWKQVYLYGGAPSGSRASSKGLRQRKSAAVRGSSAVANSTMMKGVLGEGTPADY